MQVIAHRGASAAVPEHTLAAYRRAIEMGADALECDVRMTRDGVLVCVHDRRVNRTSTGRGAVSSLELADLAELDFGSWHPSAADPEEPDHDRRRVLTLARLVELVLAAHRPVGLVVETKHPTRYAGLVEVAVVRLFERFGLVGGAAAAAVAPPVRVMSFAVRSLRRLRTLAPDLPTVLLLRWLPPAMRDGRLPAWVPAVGPSLGFLRRHPDFVGAAQATGRQVLVWTVDRPADVRYVAGLGVDGIITNRPDEVRALVRPPAGLEG